MWMKIPTVCSSSVSSGTIDSQDLVPAAENISLSSTETSSSYSSSSSMLQVIGNIDLLTLILICLPVKSLLVFKSVSKQWFSIISDPIFAIHNFRRLKPKSTGFFFKNMSPGINSHLEVKYDFLLLDGSKFEKGYQGARIFDNDPEPGIYGVVGEYRVRISQSCNGLFCCYRRTEFYDMGVNFDRPSSYKIYIYNPTTRQYRCLPPSPFRNSVPRRAESYIKVCSISLAFDPVKSMNQHYQVICIWRYEPHPSIYHWEEDILNKYYMEIYSSKTNTWRKLNSPFYGKVASYCTSGVYWNGSLHWIAGKYRNDEAESYMYFDIDRELVKPLPAPPNGDASEVMYFGEWGGHLYLIQLLKSCYTHYNILKMETDYSGWKHIHKLDLESLIDVYPRNDDLHGNKFVWRTILCLEVDETDSLSKLVMVVSGDEVISYDLKEKSVTQLFTNPGDIFFFVNAPDGGVWGHLHHYVESLACV